MLKNELNSDFARFITHEKKSLQPNYCSNVGGKTRNIAIQLVVQQCWKTVVKVCVACWVPTSFPEVAILSVSTKDRSLPVATVKGNEGSKDEVDGGLPDGRGLAVALLSQSLFFHAPGVAASLHDKDAFLSVKAN